MRHLIMRPLVVTLLAIAYSFAARAAEPINVAAAISMKESLQEIAKTYEKDTGQAVTFTFGASGQLMAQIKNGAPIDAFISAAAKQIDDLDKARLIDPATRRDVAGNALVLIVPATGATAAPDGFAGLAAPAVKRVAIGEPRTVPAGQYARQVLKNLQVEDKLAGRLVYGANVRQVLDYVERGEVTAGVVYATDAKEAKGKVKVVATADAATHEPIRYPGVVVAGSRRAGQARAFLDFLATDKARAILAAHGFTPPEAPAAAPAAGPAK